MKEQISLKDPKIQALIIVVGIGFITYITAQNLILKPAKNNITKLKAKLEHIRIENEIAGIYKEIASSEKSLPPQNDQSWLLTQVTAMAKQNNLNIEYIEPLPVKQIPPYSYTPFKIKTTCSFVELAQFVKSVESSRYIINIESVKLDSKESVSEPSKKDAEKKNLANVEIVIGTIY